MNPKTGTIPREFLKTIPRGFRLIKRNTKDFLLVESLFCPNGHNLIVDSVRIHDEASIKLQVAVGEKSGFLFIDAFWGSHAKLFSFVPDASDNDMYVAACCPYCHADLSEERNCGHRGCASGQSLKLVLPGGKNIIHVCARLGCPGHALEINDLPGQVVKSISGINFFGEGADDIFGGI